MEEPIHNGFEDEALGDSSKQVESNSDTSDVESEDSDRLDEKDDSALILQAENFKQAGNAHFAKQENKEAVESYAQGLSTLEGVSGGVEVRVALYLNKSAAETRLENWKDAATSATLALDSMKNHEEEPWVEKSKAKGLFRRAQALARSGTRLEEAKSDLVSLLQMDKTNKDALRLYAKVRADLQAAYEAHKKQFAAGFEKVSMYNDIELERKRKKLAKIEAEKKRRAAWEKEKEEAGCELSFEDWCEEDDRKKAEEEKQRKAELEQKRKAEEDARKKRLAEERKQKESMEDQEDEIELDEDERKALEETKKKGYCYFRTSHTEEEKALLASASHTKPSRIDSQSSSTTSEAPVSAWNAGGTTWEERDITSAALSSLKSTLQSVSTEIDIEGYRITTQVESVKNAQGHAQIVVSRKKPAPVFDLSAKVKWTQTVRAVTQEDDGEVCKHSGTVNIPDISTGVEEIETHLSIVKEDKVKHREIVDKALVTFCHELRSAVHATIDNFLSL